MFQDLFPCREFRSDSYTSKLYHSNRSVLVVRHLDLKTEQGRSELLLPGANLRPSKTPPARRKPWGGFILLGQRGPRRGEVASVDKYSQFDRSQLARICRLLLDLDSFDGAETDTAVLQLGTKLLFIWCASLWPQSSMKRSPVAPLAHTSLKFLAGGGIIITSTAMGKAI